MGNDRTDKKLTLIEHLEELRRRIIISAIAIMIGFGLSYFFIERIMDFLIKPLTKTGQTSRLVFMAPQEAFFAYLKLAFFAGIFLSLPVTLYQAWKFISSGLFVSERRLALIYLPFSLILFLTGALFCYFIVFPIGMKFFLGFTSPTIQPMISVTRYISFLGIMVLAFGVIFELPLVILFLTKLGVITPDFLAKKRRHALVGILVVAAILTPPDCVSQLLMALPVMILYEGSIWLSRLALARERGRGAEEQRRSRGAEEKGRNNG
ncbi:MAG: twin-arginine translocase subunit TatC [bacterium]|nr:twin-arginine translocase subunit TatC [bacterium]